ncbi:MAG: CopD family protein [Solirubrobacterales bacterium]
MDLAIRALHLIAAAVWAGGLVMLGVIAASTRQALDERARIALFRVIGRRFLVLSLLTAILIGATGVDMAVDRLPSWGALTDTSFGRLLLAKTALFAAALALGFLHGLVLGPRTRRAREALLEQPDDPELAARLRSAKRIGAIVQVSILILTLAVLVLAADLVA